MATPQDVKCRSGECTGWGFLIFKLQPLHPFFWLKVEPAMDEQKHLRYRSVSEKRKHQPSKLNLAGIVGCQSFTALSVVTAGCPAADQLIPQAQHLPRRLIVGSVVVLQATVLAELPAVGVLDRRRGIEFFNP